jgi:hypothetical protein
MQPCLDHRTRRKWITNWPPPKKMAYVVSYSHAGRYYTLRRIPAFDVRGLWSCGEARFSAHGTLRATVVFLVKGSPVGHTHEELQRIVGLRVHDTLRSLVESAELGRERVGSLFVYLDVDAVHAAAQLAARRQRPEAVAPPEERRLEPSRIIEVLVTVIHHPTYPLDHLVAALQSRGVAVTQSEVEHVLATYGVKKTARSPSRRSRVSGRRSRR